MYCMMTGASLPPLGSFAFNLMYEGIKRQRTEKIAFARFLSKMLAPISRMEDATVSLILSQYAEEVHHLNYNSDYEPVFQKIVRARVRQVNEDQRILRKVGDMTVTNEDFKNHVY